MINIRALVSSAVRVLDTCPSSAIPIRHDTRWRGTPFRLVTTRTRWLGPRTASTSSDENPAPTRDRISAEAKQSPQASVAACRAPKSSSCRGSDRNVRARVSAQSGDGDPSCLRPPDASPRRRPNAATSRLHAGVCRRKWGTSARAPAELPPSVPLRSSLQRGTPQWRPILLPSYLSFCLRPSLGPWLSQSFRALQMTLRQRSIIVSGLGLRIVSNQVRHSAQARRVAAQVIPQLECRRSGLDRVPGDTWGQHQTDAQLTLSASSLPMRPVG